MDKKREILEIALIEFSKNGYENTSLEEIAKKCNITKPAIYYHFKNKKELYSQIFINQFKEFDINLTNNLQIDLLNYIECILKIFDKKFAKLFIKELSNEFNNLNEEAFKSVIKTIKTLTQILKDTNANPFFIQTLIISSFTTYYNTINLRKKISQNIKVNSDFDIKEEVKKIILDYVKE